MKDNHENGHSDAAPAIVAFGNCLLDLSVEIPDNTILDEFQLKKDDQGEISFEKLRKITKSAARYGHPIYNPGGSALNSIKILRKLGEQNTLFCGSIGNDENGRTLTSLYHDQIGLKTRLQILEQYATGTCICLINGAQRSLYANIGAAQHYRKDLLDLNIPQGSTNSTIFYIEGYFVSEKIDVCRHIFETYCQGTSNILATNLNASYILKTFGEGMKFLVENSKLVFGNRKEFTTLAEIYQFEDIDRVAGHLISRTTSEKILVVTDGDRPVWLYRGSGCSLVKTEHRVEKVPRDSIVDTTGAGDGFVAGFLYKFVRKKSLDECVEYGNEISGRVIQTLGCNLP